MSESRAMDWLQTFKSDDYTINHAVIDSDHVVGIDSSDSTTKIISITSGKGGVGKSTIAVKMSMELAKQNHKVLLIDCDYNLSNAAIKLNLPLTGQFYDLVSSQKSFDDCLYKVGNLHLLSGCNGNLSLFQNGLEFDKFIIDIIAEHRKEYRYIILDCPAGASREAINLNAYSDHRVFVVNPDKSSITDSYSLMKILSKQYGVSENYLVVNRYTSDNQYKRVVKTVSETAEHFLKTRTHILGGIKNDVRDRESFDQVLLKDENSAAHKSFVKILRSFTEKSKAPLVSGGLLASNQ